MAFSILTRKQIPSALVYLDVANTFTQPQYLPAGAPSLDTEAANKKYVDDKITTAATGLEVKVAARVATTASVGTYTATTGSSTRGQLTAAPNTLDGVSLAIGNRILVKNHATAAANGIYTVTSVGTGADGIWDRAADFDSDPDVKANSFIFIEEGSLLADTAWVLTTNNPIIIGGASGTGLVWTQFAGSGVGITSISVANLNGLTGSSSGGSTPVITLSTSLGAGLLRSNGAGALVIGSVDLSGGEVTNQLPVAKGGTGASTLTGVLKGNGTGAFTPAVGTDLTALIAGNAVTNATNSVNSGITNDIGTATQVFPTWVGSNSGNQPSKVSSTALYFIPSTGTFHSTAFTGNGAGLTNLAAANITGTIATAALGNSTLYIGTTAVPLNRASANQAMTGILSTMYSGATSGTSQLMAQAVAGANNILYLPLVAGTLVSTGDTGTVTNTMLAGAIADAKLNQITTASKVSTAALTGTVLTLGSTAIGALSTVGTIAGMTSITSTTFVGALTGNSTGFTGSLGGEITGAQGSTAIAATTVTGKALTGFVSGAGTITAADTILSAINKLNGNDATKQASISSSNFKVGVAVTGVANGTNLAFTLPNSPLASTEMVFVNGVVQQRGAGNDYQISGATITFEAGNAPQVGAILVATYFV